MERLVKASSVIENKGLWKGVIVNLVREVVSSVDPNVRNGDNLDIRHYVKLKIIPGNIFARFFVHLLGAYKTWRFCGVSYSSNNTFKLRSWEALSVSSSMDLV